MTSLGIMVTARREAVEAMMKPHAFRRANTLLLPAELKCMQYDGSAVVETRLLRDDALTGQLTLKEREIVRLANGYAICIAGVLYRAFLKVPYHRHD